MSRLIGALKFAHSPQLMKPALVHTPPRISNPLSQRERGAAVFITRTQESPQRPPCWGRGRIGRKQSLPRLGPCAILLYYPCTQSHGGNAVLPLILLSPLHLSISLILQDTAVPSFSILRCINTYRDKADEGWGVTAPDDAGMQCATREQQAVTMVKFQWRLLSWEWINLTVQDEWLDLKYSKQLAADVLNGFDDLSIAGESHSELCNLPIDLSLIW